MYTLWQQVSLFDSSLYIYSLNIPTDQCSKFCEFCRHYAYCCNTVYMMDVYWQEHFKIFYFQGSNIIMIKFNNAITGFSGKKIFWVIIVNTCAFKKAQYKQFTKTHLCSHAYIQTSTFFLPFRSVQVFSPQTTCTSQRLTPRCNIWYTLYLVFSVSAKLFKFHFLISYQFHHILPFFLNKLL